MEIDRFGVLVWSLKMKIWFYSRFIIGSVGSVVQLVYAQLVFDNSFYKSGIPHLRLFIGY